MGKPIKKETKKPELVEVSFLGEFSLEEFVTKELVQIMKKFNK